MVAASRLKLAVTDGWISKTLVKSYRVFFTTFLASFPPERRKKKKTRVRALQHGRPDLTVCQAYFI